jgi:hypothetical protein
VKRGGSNTPFCNTLMQSAERTYCTEDERSVKHGVATKFQTFAEIPFVFEKVCYEKLTKIRCLQNIEIFAEVKKRKEKIFKAGL